jgi:hypothetical protein
MQIYRDDGCKRIKAPAGRAAATSWTDTAQPPPIAVSFNLLSICNVVAPTIGPEEIPIQGVKGRMMYRRAVALPH